MSPVSQAGWGQGVVSIHPDQGNQRRLPNGGDVSWASGNSEGFKMMRNGKPKHHLGQRKQNKDGSRHLQVNGKEGLCVARAGKACKGVPGMS